MRRENAPKIYHYWFFLADRWIAWGVMLSGIISAGYAFSVCIRYYYSGHVRPLIFGETPMAFSTSVLLVLNGLSLFWTGFHIREHTFRQEIRRPFGEPMTSAQIVQLILALISAFTLVATTWIGATKR